MLTKSELEFCERVPYELGRIADAIAKLHGVLTGAPDKGKTPVKLEPPAREEHPKDSPFDCLAVTKVEVFPYPYNSGCNGLVQGLATVVINDQLTLKDLTVCVSKETGLYVGYPTNNYFPMTRQLREHIENCVLETYRAVTK